MQAHVCLYMCVLHMQAKTVTQSPSLSLLNHKWLHTIPIVLYFAFFLLRNLKETSVSVSRKLYHFLLLFILIVEWVLFYEGITLWVTHWWKSKLLSIFAIQIISHICEYTYITLIIYEILILLIIYESIISGWRSISIYNFNIYWETGLRKDHTNYSPNRYVWEYPLPHLILTNKSLVLPIWEVKMLSQYSFKLCVFKSLFLNGLCIENICYFIFFLILLFFC